MIAIWSLQLFYDSSIAKDKLGFIKENVCFQLFICCLKYLCNVHSVRSKVNLLLDFRFYLIQLNYYMIFNAGSNTD